MMDAEAGVEPASSVNALMAHVHASPTAPTANAGTTAAEKLAAHADMESALTASVNASLTAMTICVETTDVVVCAVSPARTIKSV